ncbi:uncharacterized protein Z518_11246 [Rhinocladiella mackenziei CBS 650.93]|uniref:Glycosyl hydrolase family 13 catalytic domain-containing protein n=1 Tax=Rhinocladiella mackenziei CBS 650.93 TaxID=1442369 RepID=A0A0D2GMD8_9EURO|nr:uncharacterized protein Z518_11246 [Rhinocladiella mackenziei CBS 650.93]KIW99507.1 hypothetical protein Z518_11246 [Rhinocladiella mackenziei CBS 650.93]
MAPSFIEQPIGGWSAAPVARRAWWKEASVYQIYPSSFKDSNHDGIGDIPGILSKLDYIKELGVDAIWLCPVYKSPKVDMGYDIADYHEIDSDYGNLADLDRLIAAAHERGLNVVMDLVVNHTSDQHEWFQKSRSSKDNEYRQWYIWRKPRYDSQGNRYPPNNWWSYFHGSAWEYDEVTDEYYLHIFCAEQPDLNWEHPPLRRAIHDIMRFWLERGGLPDAPVTDRTTTWQQATIHYAAGPRLHEYLKEIGAILEEYGAFSVDGTFIFTLCFQDSSREEGWIF